MASISFIVVHLLIMLKIILQKRYKGALQNMYTMFFLWSITLKFQWLGLDKQNLTFSRTMGSLARYIQTSLMWTSPFFTFSKGSHCNESVKQPYISLTVYSVILHKRTHENYYPGNISTIHSLILQKFWGTAMQLVCKIQSVSMGHQ